jgi:hypothetical protein
MFITKEQIAHLKMIEQDPRIAMAIGQPIEYYFLTHGGTGVCGMPGVLIGLREGFGCDGNYFADIGIQSPIEDIYVQLESLEVLSLLVERKDGSTPPLAIADANEIKAITEIINGNDGGHPVLVPPIQ